MINGKRIAVVLPAYNAEKTLEATVRELPDLVDIRILVDDHSSDRTLEVAQRLGLQSFVHNRNYGYGRNQQTCYREALAAGADVVIMVHPDYQYTPLLVTAMASMIAYGVYDVVSGSRIIGGTALRGGMPLYKYVANRLLTAFENLFLGVKLSEYHTGYRAFSRDRAHPPAAAREQRRFRFRQPDARPVRLCSASASAKSPAPPNISRKLPPSISVAACNTASGAADHSPVRPRARRHPPQPHLQRKGKDARGRLRALLPRRNPDRVTAPVRDLERRARRPAALQTATATRTAR
jgi:glycosyltransferase involved in cell wall biosynthesis